jgi:probable addiction module antidote protein
MTIKLYPFDAADCLTTPEHVEAYLQVALEENDPEFFQEALGTVARSKGMQAIARQAKTTRAGLYKALSAAGNPEFATVIRVVEALGYRFSVKPVRKRANTETRAVRKTAKRPAKRAAAERAPTKRTATRRSR